MLKGRLFHHLRSFLKGKPLSRNFENDPSHIRIYVFIRFAVDTCRAIPAPPPFTHSSVHQQNLEGVGNRAKHLRRILTYRMFMQSRVSMFPVDRALTVRKPERCLNAMM